MYPPQLTMVYRMHLKNVDQHNMFKLELVVNYQRNNKPTRDTS